MDESSTEELGGSGSKSYERARAQVERKHRFWGDVAAYTAVNVFLLGVWIVGRRGYFWPGWVLAGWGVLALLHGWNVFYRRPVSDAEVVRELERSRGPRSGDGIGRIADGSRAHGGGRSL